MERLNGVYTKLLNNAGVTLFGAVLACTSDPRKLDCQQGHLCLLP